MLNANTDLFKHKLKPYKLHIQMVFSPDRLACKSGFYLEQLCLDPKIVFSVDN